MREENMIKEWFDKGICNLYWNVVYLLLFVVILFFLLMLRRLKKFVWVIIFVLGIINVFVVFFWDGFVCVFVFCMMVLIEDWGGFFKLGVLGVEVFNFFCNKSYSLYVVWIIDKEIYCKNYFVFKNL